MNLKIVAATAALLAVQGSSAALAQAVTETGSVTASASSWVLGGQAGYNWQRGAWVYGLAADISAMNLSSQSNIILPGPFTVPASLSADIDWYGTVRGLCSGTPKPQYGLGKAGRRS